MAAEIDSMAFFGATPWHRIGTIMTDAERTNVRQAMAVSKTDWEVERIPLFYDGVQVPDAWGIRRTDTMKYLGTVGKHTHPIQNHESFELLEPFIDRGCKVEVMGGLAGGRDVFGLLSMPDTEIEVTKGDVTRGYFCVSNNHVGLGALSADLTPIRVVCANTLALMKSSGRTTAVSIRHSKNSQDKIQQAKDTLEKLVEVFALTGESFKQMAEREMRPLDIQAYIDSVLPSQIDPETQKPSPVVEARREKIVELAYHGKGQNYKDDQPIPLWALLNGVTEYFDHHRADEAKSQSMAVKSYDSALFGLNAQIKAKAFGRAMELVS